MDVSIIIVNYNTINLVLNCIRSIRKHTEGIKYEIIVIDNNSNKEDSYVLKETFPDVILQRMPENLGFGKANNEGIKISKGRNILFLNPDTVLLNNAITILSNQLDQNLGYGAVGGNLYTNELMPNESYHMRFPFLFDEIDQITRRFFSKIWYGRNSMFNHTTIPKKVAYIIGADLMIKKKVLDSVGCFDPCFFMYYEETDLSIRIRKGGYSIYSIPDARIIHFEGKSFNCSYSREKMALISRRLFLIKHRSIFYEHLASMVMLYSSLIVKSFLHKKSVLRKKLNQRINILQEILNEGY